MGRAKGHTTDRFQEVIGSRRGVERQDTVTITNSVGRSFIFRIVAFGDSYGHMRQIKNTRETKVEIYDTAHAGSPNAEPEGQIVSNFSFDKTLDLLSRFNSPGNGVSLHGDTPNWFLDKPAMKEAYDALRSFKI
jgi:hypothetical protein